MCCSDPLVAVTVFTIELLPSNRTLYKLCGRFNNSAGAGRAGRHLLTVTDRQSTAPRPAPTPPPPAPQPEQNMRVEVQCGDNEAFGHFVFIRDDRKKEETFRVCEVEVFAEETEGGCFCVYSTQK